MTYTAGDKVLIQAGEHKGKRGRVVSVNAGGQYPNYVKVYGSVIRCIWYGNDEIAADRPQVPAAEADESVNYPGHYTWLPNGLEVIDFAEHLTFNRGCAVQCLARAGHMSKSTELEDLKKARWYIQREITRLEKP
ncbi:DUF3310 domain-containing protein [Streptomyces sp. NPDC048281]|uniref:DUF3310 domain-containing protein n=1 Tax=Streptomyces sp. NPDC048281 TaxID=3154715 RepID=UPI003422648C